MKRVRHIISIFLLLTFFMSITVFAYESVVPEAEFLYAVGLLRGSEEGLTLNQDMTRAQAAVMVVRLMGAQDLAISTNAQHPFTDVPDWASPYVGYLYTKGITAGLGEGIYGSNETITRTQFMTFLLRTMGYDDKSGDFYWATSLSTAANLGIVDSGTQETGTFDRGLMSEDVYHAIMTPMKGTTNTLFLDLEERGMLFPMIEEATKIYTLQTSTLSLKPSNMGQLKSSLIQQIFDFISETTYDVTALEQFNDVDTINDTFDEMMNEVLEAMVDIPGYVSAVDGYRLSINGDRLTVNFTYNVDKTSFYTARDLARRIVASNISEEMDMYQKALILHDYIIDHVEYDDQDLEDDKIYTFYGALMEGQAVCQGYADAFQLMGYMSGIDTAIVSGDGISNGVSIGHMWNMIKLEDDFYHLDTTWDDPVLDGGRGTKSYEYFNLADEQMAVDHVWETSDYQNADGSKYNYYVYNHLIVNSLDDLRSQIQEGWDDERWYLTYKMANGVIEMKTVADVLSSTYGFNRVAYRVNEQGNIVTIERME